MNEDDLVKFARQEALRLRGRALGRQSNIRPANLVRPEASTALDFLRRYAPDSHFYSDARAMFGNQSVSPPRVLAQVADVLDDWANFVETGLASALPYEARARVDAATDLMEQVQRLLDDANVHAAAPVMLAGAALEEFLRSMIAASGTTATGKPGIQSYAQSLLTAGHLSAQDVKDITGWGGQRNEAAHGEFAKLSRPRAQIMVDGINLFMIQKTSAP